MKLQRKLPTKMAVYQIIFLLLLRLMAGVVIGAEQDYECMPTRCGKDGPEIRFPFRLRKRQPKHCGYHPGFDLSCSTTPHGKHFPILELPFSVKVSVKKIDYKSQTIHIYDPDGCLPRQLPNLNLSSSPFQIVLSYYSFDFSFFSCPSTIAQDPIRVTTLITCLSNSSHKVYAIQGDYIEYEPVLSCTKMGNISLQLDAFDHPLDRLLLNWSKPTCGYCEAEGKYCGWQNSSSSRQHGPECIDKPKRPTTGTSRKLEVAGLVLGLSLLVAVVIALYLVHRSHKRKKVDQIKIENFLEDYKALKPARYSYGDLKKITNQFQDEVGQGAYGTVYKGELSNDVHVAVKILNNVKANGDEFINEVGIIGKIHHVNVVRLVGYCADGFRRALLYEFLPNNSLEKFISSNHEKRLLGWGKLQDIALGIAKGIEYLHLGCDQRILHFDIKPRNILLDHNFNPKVSDFGQAKLCSKEQSAVSMTTARGTLGYIAPEVFSRNFGNVSYKSDVYSFGMLLLEMVGGKKETTTQNTGQLYFPEWIYDRLDQGEELGIQIEQDGDEKIAKKLTIVGLWCIQWYPVDRPSMKVVVQILEGDGGTLTLPPNPFASTNPTATRGNSMAGRSVNSELQVISELE